MVPSTNKLRQLVDSQTTALLLRRVLDGRYNLKEIDEREFPGAALHLRQCFNRPPSWLIRLYMANDLIDGASGVEGVSAGRGTRSPAFDYVNLGDPYVTTLVYIHGTGFRVQDYGSLIERGDYD